jgi:hypothetical protein
LERLGLWLGLAWEWESLPLALGADWVALAVGVASEMDTVVVIVFGEVWVALSVGVPLVAVQHRFVGVAVSGSVTVSVGGLDTDTVMDTSSLRLSLAVGRTLLELVTGIAPRLGRSSRPRSEALREWRSQRPAPRRQPRRDETVWLSSLPSSRFLSCTLECELTRA